nr:MAG TPA: Receptor Binding Protein [Caudoviricetes sp.]
MASIKSFPNNQDTYIGAEEVMRWLHGRTSGVFAAAGNAAVAALKTPGMAVTVTDGTGWLADAGGNGIVWWNDKYVTSGALLQLTVDIADAALARIDRVIVEWKTTNYVDLPEIKVLKGTPASGAVAPALTNNRTLRQISLAKITIPAGSTKITASMITDERLDSSVCGLVTDGLTVDTTTMQAQFSAFLAKIQNDLANIEAGSGLVTRQTYTAVLTKQWTGSGPYTQTVTVAGVLASDMPHVVPVYDADNTMAKAQREAWGCVSRGVAAAGGIQFTCFGDKPETAIPIQIEVMR